MCYIAKTTTTKTVLHDKNGNKVKEYEGFIYPSLGTANSDLFPITIKHIRITEEIVNVMHVKNEKQQ